MENERKEPVMELVEFFAEYEGELSPNGRKGQEPIKEIEQTERKKERKKKVMGRSRMCPSSSPSSLYLRYHRY